MKNAIKKSCFWISFTLISLIASLISYHYFPKAFPLIHLNLSMDRHHAFEKAKVLANELNLETDDYRTAASFITDEQVKTFVELEAGGKKKFVAMMKENLYQPYRWHVRLFKPFTHHEVAFLFTPDGTPYGFQEKLSENEARENLSQQEARTRAQAFAQASPWNIDFNMYKLIESSQATVASGRINHTLVYERKDTTIGEGFYRLKVVISGNKPTELTHEVKVPNAFLRRYQHMRSAHETITYAAILAMLLLYITCGIGISILIKKRWLVWKPAVFLGMFIGALFSIGTINNLPILWMSYNTALSPYNFLAEKFMFVVLSFTLVSLSLSFIFIGSEGLTRMAFGHQIQFWKMFTPVVSGSRTVLGYISSSYLLVPILLAYTVIFYIFTTHHFNWWTPSEELFNPNILASYVPWLNSIATSLYAGFNEECSFRAIPLATAALLGQRYGKKSWWIAGAFIFQALIFGAAHANYPTQPSYARLVELLLFSAIAGGIYLRFGLIPAIITHFVYDVVWFSLPLFVSTASHAWVNQAMVIILSVVPLFVALRARIKAGAWSTIPDYLYNKAWHTSETPTPDIPQTPLLYKEPSQRMYHKYIIAGIVGLVLWIACTRFSPDVFPFTVTRTQATEKALQLLRSKNVDTAQWYPITYPIITIEQTPEFAKVHRFVWSEGGKDIYRRFIGTYLTPPSWVVRFVTRKGDIVERSREHHFYFLPDGSLKRYRYKLPESEPGTSLTKEAAQRQALEVIYQQFHKTADQLKEVAAVSTKQPARLDWVITYSSATDYPLSQGEARINVEVAGDKIVDAFQYVHVPEQWGRAYDNKYHTSMIISLICFFALAFLFLAFLIYIFIQRSIYITRKFIVIFMTLFGMLLFEVFNYWPTVIASFNTSQPFIQQAFRAFGIPSIATAIKAAALTLVINFISQWKTSQRSTTTLSRWAAIGIGTWVSGMLATVQFLIPSLSPLWASYEPLVFLIPHAGGIIRTLLAYNSLTIYSALLTIACAMFYKRRWLVILMLLVAGFVASGCIDTHNITLWAVSGVALAATFIAIYFTLAPHNLSLIPLSTGSYIILNLMQQALFCAYPYAWILNIGTALIVALVSWYWHKAMTRSHET